jgi:lipoprotein-anchoring transpeptidase ErfK/SrfK
MTFVLGAALLVMGLPPPAVAANGQDGYFIARTAQVSVMGESWQIPQQTAALSANRSLSSGVCGEDVYAVGMLLSQAGYLSKAPSFRYDSSIQKAVARFQADYNLKSDGIVGSTTYEALNNMIAQNSLAVTAMEIGFAGEKLPQGKWIVINKTLNKLFFIESSQVVAQFPVGTGATPGLTPEGRFSIVSKIVNPAWGGGGYANPVAGGASNNPLGKRWMGLSIGGGGAYGIHGNANESSIGKYVSHGCIRMHNADVNAFFPQVSVGTPVYIGTNDSLRKHGIEFAFSEAAPKSYILMAINGKAVPDAAPLVRNGKLLVPMRQVIEGLGGTITWQGKNQPVLVDLAGSTMEFSVGSDSFSVNGEVFAAGTSAELIRGRMMVPIDMCAQLQGVSLAWDPEAKTVRLTSGALPFVGATGPISF